MKPYAIRNQFRCVLLEPADWKVLRDFHGKQVMESGNAEDIDVFKAARVDLWQEMLASPETKTFCLMDGKIVAGGGDLNVEEAPTLGENLYILKAYRRRTLSDLIYRAWFNYIIDHDDVPLMQIQIEKSNVVARHTALRNGFRKAAKQSHKEFTHYLRDLSDWQFHLDV